MKRYYTILLLAIAFGVGFSACSKDDERDPKSNGSSLTMKVNGSAWGAVIHTLLTEQHENSEDGEYYVVHVGGQRIDVENSEDDVSSLSMYIAVPKSKFNNPKGTYPILKESEFELGQTTAIYTESTDKGSTWYASYNPDNPNQIVGTVEITDFEVGNQVILGQQIGEIGYTMLSGSFKMEMYPVVEGGGAPVKITEGKFDLKSGLGFDF